MANDDDDEEEEEDVGRMVVMMMSRRCCCHCRRTTTMLMTRLTSWFEMKTASLGLLEVWWYRVVRVNAGGDAPPDPPLLVTSGLIPPFFVFSRKFFGELAGKYI